MIPLVKPFIPPREELMPELEAILYSGYIAEGEPVYEFERQFSTYLGNPHLLALHSGTDALHLSLILAGVGRGDEVISTALTAEPTNVAITMVGAKVVWGDVDQNTGLLCPKSVESLISEKTKAILLVHYAGMVCDMDAFNDISERYGIPIIEDAAHALGSKYKNKRVGSNSPFTIFSLQAIKHMTTIDGGILTFDSNANMDRARRMRWFGLDKGKSRLENDITETGYKYAMNNVNATVGLVQMKHVDSIVNQYISNGKYFDNELKQVEGVELLQYYDHTEPSYWLYTMKVDRRDEFIKKLAEHNISASPLHHRNDSHSIFASSKRNLPNLDVFYNKMVHIPCGWWLSEDDRAHIVNVIKAGW